MQFFKLVLLSPLPLLLIIVAALIKPTLTWGLKGAGIAAAILLAVLCTPLVANTLLSRLEWYAPVELTDPHLRNAQAIVVLCAEQRNQPEFGGIGPGPLSLERARYGAYLARRTRLPILVSGGDPDRNGTPLANSLATALADSFGVTPRWLERNSMDTVGNARESAKILKAAGVTRVLLVTHAWHMPRARLAFEQAGLQVMPAPTAAIGNPLRRAPHPGDVVLKLVPQASGLQTSYYFFHEVIGLAALKLAPAGQAPRT